MFEKLPEACASGSFLRRKREMAPMGNAAAFPEHLAEGNSTAQVHWCTARSPDVSLRGAKRRGNLAEHGRTTGKPSAKSQLPSRDCHVGLRPPRNDKSGSHHRFSDSPCESFVQRRERHAAPLQWRVRSAECHKTCNCLRRSLTAATPHFSAVSVFNGSWYEATVPARDCHVGLRPPCNDESGSCTPRDRIFV